MQGHFSTISYNFKNRFTAETIEKVFYWILNEIEQAGYLTPETVFVDGTHTLFLEHFTQCVLHHVAELRELKTTVADGQIKTKEDGARQEDVQPCYSVKGAGDKTNDCLHRFCLRTIPRSSILS